jgi:hypothetical protein
MAASARGPWVLASGLASQGLRPVRAAADGAGRMALAGLDAVLGWRYTEEAIRRVLDSPVAGRTVEHALGGPLVDAVARDLVRYAVLERVVDELAAGDSLERVLARAEAADLPQRVLERLLEDGVADRMADRLLEGPELEGVATRLIESRLLDTIVERLLESEELWRLVDEIAHSPSVTDAIGQQSAGFADQLAGRMRAQSRRADAEVERVARRLLRRPPPAPGAGEDGAP